MRASHQHLHTHYTQANLNELLDQIGGQGSEQDKQLLDRQLAVAGPYVGSPENREQVQRQLREILQQSRYHQRQGGCLGWA